MQLHSLGIIAVIGTLVFLAGVHLLWVNRNLAIDWMREFVLILRGEFARKGGANFDATAAGRKMYHHGSRSGVQSGTHTGAHSGALILLGALGLMFLGQALVLLDLTF